MEIVKTLGDVQLLKHKPTEEEFEEDYVDIGSFAIRFYVDEFYFNRVEHIWQADRVGGQDFVVYVAYKNATLDTLDVYLDNEESFNAYKEGGRYYHIEPDFLVRSFETGLDIEVMSDSASNDIRNAYLLALEDLQEKLQ